MRKAPLFLSLPKEREDRVRTDEAKMNSRGTPTRLRASREIGILKAVRYKLSWRVANPPCHPDVIRIVDLANETV